MKIDSFNFCILFFSDTLRKFDFDEVADKNSILGAILKNMINGHTIILESLDDCVNEAERTPLPTTENESSDNLDSDSDVESQTLKDGETEETNDVQEDALINKAIKIDFHTIANPTAENCTQMKVIDDLLYYRSMMTKVDQKGAVYGKC